MKSRSEVTYYPGIEYDKGFFDGYDCAESEIMRAFIDLTFEEFRDIWVIPFFRKCEERELEKESERLVEESRRVGT
jgi:hypothetical protein